MIKQAVLYFVGYTYTFIVGESFKKGEPAVKSIDYSCYSNKPILIIEREDGSRETFFGIPFSVINKPENDTKYKGLRDMNNY